MLKTLAAELLARRCDTLLPLASPASMAESTLESASVMVMVMEECEVCGVYEGFGLAVKLNGVWVGTMIELDGYN
jgi:hypothetical protein